MFSHRTDILTGFFYKGNQVSAAHEQMQLSCLRLSHFQNLSQESGGAVDVAVHHEIVFLILWCHRLELVDGGRDDGEGVSSSWVILVSITPICRLFLVFTFPYTSVPQQRCRQ